MDTVEVEVAVVDLAGPFLLDYELSTNSEGHFMISASHATPFILVTATDLDGMRTPLLTNTDPCIAVAFTDEEAALTPRRFFRAVPWDPPAP